eukprot:CAMPEP_0173353700 /NCGR_PEP_ID=MMETSP1144-20121109/16765_1 /TAXON_ID=483371 /ORGANISM="non described non described, Strain CCMP2298" /LENGTH=72 /DNA_ID=CAMNT_0014302147 /DNA_START=18 /DNA_END=236 /DNA_ORIENTATION=+
MKRCQQFSDLVELEEMEFKRSRSADSMHSLSSSRSDDSLSSESDVASICVQLERVVVHENSKKVRNFPCEVA